jgi:aspartate aminotransferase
MSILSKRVLDMKESATLAMARKSREMKESGIDIINLSLGEPDFDTPENIKNADKKALDAGLKDFEKLFAENLKEKII